MKQLLFFCVLSLFACTCGKRNNGFGTGGGSTDPGTNPNPPVVTPKKNFYVDGTTLRDSAGKAFVIRGNNFPVFWFPNDYKPSIKAAASLGCNAARLVWQTQQEAWTPPLTVLDQAIAECVANKIVPVVELHDYTGGTSAADISEAAAYYVRADVKAIMDKYSHVIILNIANEWGGNSVSSVAWKNAYLPAITTLRNAGYRIPIMIDAPGYGQMETAIVDYGKDLLNSDPLGNVIFSTHAYSNWNNSGTFTSRIDAILNKQLCFIFGEYGWDVPDNQQPADFICKVNAPLLMQLCQTKKVGYMGWSWKGNNAANACFEMCGSWSDTSQLTFWGRQWAYDVNGVKNTGVKASIY